jgi:SAM-dependent methyltransferase
MKLPCFDQVLLCAFHLWRSRQPGKHYHVVIVTDDEERHPERVCRAMLGQWREWVTVEEYWALGPTRVESGAVANPAGVCLAAVSDAELLAVIRERCRRAGMPLIEPRIPEPNEPEHDLYSEVSFFDIELGGRNEWNDAPPQHPGLILQKLSAVHCRASYPAWGLHDMPQRNGPWRVLDVGCGPVSVLRWGALAGRMTLTGLDPLLEMYALVRARHGLDALPEIRCAVEIPAFAEQLDELVPDGAFDLIYTRNALDHTREPERVAGLFAHKLVPGGRALIEVATCEGTRQNWNELHKTDIDLRDGVLVYRHQHTEPQPLLPPGSGLELRRIGDYSKEWLAVVLERTD